MAVLSTLLLLAIITCFSTYLLALRSTVVDILQAPDKQWWCSYFKVGQDRKNIKITRRLIGLSTNSRLPLSHELEGRQDENLLYPLRRCLCGLGKRPTAGMRRPTPLRGRLPPIHRRGLLGRGKAVPRCMWVEWKYLRCITPVHHCTLSSTYNISWSCFSISQFATQFAVKYA